MIKIHFLVIPDAIDKKVFKTLLSHLSPEKQSRISRCIREQDRQCALWADVLVRTTVCSTLGIKNTAIVFTKNEFGKPCLEDHPGLHFNVSHSGDVVLCAFDNKPVGVDVEKIKDRGPEIAERFFSAMEYDWLMRRNEPERTECFFDLWTLKESYSKALGKGITKGLRSFTIYPEGRDIFVDDEQNENARKDYFFRRYDIKTGFKASVCAQNDDFPANVAEIRCEDLFREFMKHI